MYNLLIVDDEEMVVNGLVYDVNWSDMGITEIFKTYDASQAIDCMAKNRIDIVISDIRMPEIDGLELAAKIREQWPHSKIIFISGFDEFEYAQRAIDLGALSFITKPARHEKVQEAVKRAIEEIEKELVIAQILENDQKRFEEVLPILKERHFNAWITHGSLSFDKAVDKLFMTGVQLDLNSSAFIVIIKTDNYGPKFPDVNEGIYEIALKNIIDAVFFKGKNGIVFNDYEGNQIILVSNSTTDELKKIYIYIQHMAETFQQSVYHSLGSIVSVCWGDIVMLGDLHEEYKKILFNARRKLICSEGIIMSSGKAESGISTGKIKSLNSYPSFLTVLESMDKNNIVLFIERVFEELESKLSNENMLNIYYTVTGALMEDSIKRDVKLDSWAGKTHDSFYRFELIKSVNDLKLWCIEVTKKYVEYVLNIEKKSSHYLIDKVKNMIKERLKDDVPLSEIASCLFIHPNYLSRLFKEKEGISITDYRIICRIEKAKELLKVPGIKVYEVAGQVGCGSVASLNRIFKKITGLSPKEYQSNT